MAALSDVSFGREAESSATSCRRLPAATKIFFYKSLYSFCYDLYTLHLHWPQELRTFALELLPILKVGMLGQRELLQGQEEQLLIGMIAAVVIVAVVTVAVVVVVAELNFRIYN